MKINFTRDQIKQLILEDPDFINSPRHDYKLSSLLETNPNGVTDRFAATLLMLTPEEFQKGMEGAVKKYRQIFKIDID